MDGENKALAIITVSAFIFLTIVVSIGLYSDYKLEIEKQKTQQLKLRLELRKIN